MPRLLIVRIDLSLFFCLNRVAADACFDQLSHFHVHIRIFESLSKDFAVGHAMPRQLASEFQILVSAGDVLGDRQVMHFEAKPRDAAGVGILDSHKTTLPSLWENSGPLSYTLRSSHRALGTASPRRYCHR